MKASPDRHVTPIIAFDWDGTIVDSVPYKLAQNQAIAAEFGNALTAAEVRHKWNASSGFTDLMHSLTDCDDMAKIMEVVKRDYNNPVYAKREFDFAKLVLKQLKLDGYHLALVTNLTREMLEADARSLKFGLQENFDFTQGSNESKYNKPHERTFWRMCRYLGITTSQLLYVGDEIKDYETTANAGSEFVGVTTGMTTAEEFNDFGIPHIPNIAHLPNYLNRR